MINEKGRQPDVLDQLLGFAIEMAGTAHTEQYDKHGVPYILHPLHVMQAVESYGRQYMIVAILHDVVEDNEDFTIAMMKEKFGPVIADAIDSVTKRKGESYIDFIKRTHLNKIGRVVKNADIDHNMLIDRLMLLDPKTRARLVNKYAEGKKYL